MPGVPDPMIDREVSVSTGALCLKCGVPVKRTSTVSGENTPRFCPEHQEQVEGYPRRTCRECGEKLREPSGLCGWCEEEREQDGR